MSDLSTARLDGIDPERFMLFGEWLCGKVEACTCATGPEGQHEPHCGLEPVATLDEIVNAEHRVADAKAELERTEGDLAVAVHEATEARATVQRVREALRTRETELHEAIPPSLRSAAVASGSVKVATGEIYAALAAPVQPEETQQ